ncbi:MULTISPECIES: response regulator [unclassified Sphingomonas]|uniref:response regulator n=1 Tax=unclassified Sphingomonas TaxID=196159 RepID=UPI000926476B|nr:MULTISPECIES: response regulator [unclassified Sphingomonas]MBN8847176.1 response regulator [Sphingomonas sp.]OJV32629.1 MAG: hypothetical protein BGO24_02495 [Sphingomonas sp. 67-36]
MRASRRILCVEDQADLLDDLVLELSDHGYRVEGCRDGHAALALFSAERFDLIICDIQLPGMGGIELLNRVRQLPEERSEVPAIFLSAFGDPEVVRAGTAQGAAAYFVKPVDYRDLLGSVDTIMRIGSD